MHRPSRILAIILLAVFAFGTVAHAARATSMALAMSPAAMDGGMGDCDGCPPDDDGKMLSCAQFCLAPFTAIPAAAGIELPLVATEIAASPLNETVGHTGRPEPSPPRTTILN